MSIAIVAGRDPSTKGRKLWSSRGRRGFEGKKYPDRVKVVEVLHEEWAEHASTYVRLLRLLEIAVECEQERKQGQDIDEQGIEKEGKKTHNNVATPAKIGSVASENYVPAQLAETTLAINANYNFPDKIHHM